jgi:hypothetical protein
MMLLFLCKKTHLDFLGTSLARSLSLPKHKKTETESCIPVPANVGSNPSAPRAWNIPPLQFTMKTTFYWYSYFYDVVLYKCPTRHHQQACVRAWPLKSVVDHSIFPFVAHHTKDSTRHSGRTTKEKHTNISMTNPPPGAPTGGVWYVINQSINQSITRCVYYNVPFEG